MKLTRISGECPDKVTCPTVYATDRGTVVVQGYRVTDRAAVEIPRSLWEGAGATDRGTVVIEGDQVMDSEALDQLKLPEGENAIEIPRSRWETKGGQ